MKKSLSLILSIGILLTLIGSLPSPAHAETQYRYASPEGTYSGDCTIATPCSLQRAVDLTNGAAAGVETTIYLKSGTYVADTSRWYPEVIRITNSMNLVGRCDFSSGSAVCIPENAPSTLSGETVRRIIMLQLSDPEVIHLFNLNLVYGNGNEQQAGECPSAGEGDSRGCGGAIHALIGAYDANELKIENRVFQYNYGWINSYPTSGEQGVGGAISLTNFGVLRINNSTFDRNTAILDGNGYGGAIFSLSNQTIIQNTEFIRNRCTVYATLGQGCALNIHQGEGLTDISSNSFTLNNTNTTPTNDKRRPGGAIYLSSPEQVKIVGNAITENDGESALAFFVKGGTTDNLISRNKFWGNFTDYALDIYYYPTGSGQAIVNLLHNFVGYQWGYDSDIYTTNGVQLTAPTSSRLAAHLWNNSLACLDMGVHVVDLVDIDITNNIIGWTTEGVVSYSDYPTVGPEITGSTNMIYFTNSVDMPDTDLIVTDPKFVSLMDGELHLTKTSPAINRGVNMGLVEDIDGDRRADGLPDIGADEFVVRLYLPLLAK